MRHRERVRGRPARTVLMGLALCALAMPAGAQTDYYNTDARRPVRIEDAYAVERYAFELQLAPVRLERSDAATYTWEIEPELAYGILPRTSIEIGMPWVSVDGADGRISAPGGVHLTFLHNLNIETASLPAFGIAARALLPVGGLAPERALTSLVAIATRTFGFARVHLNAEHTFGSAAASDPHNRDLSRWMAGVAIDRTFPLDAALLIADVFVEQPLDDEGDLVWTVEAGTRYQLDPYLALDAGIGRRLNGEPGWFVTFGAARAFALRSLFPVPRR